MPETLLKGQWDEGGQDKGPVEPEMRNNMG